MKKVLLIAARNSLVATIMIVSVFGTAQKAIAADLGGDSDGWYDEPSGISDPSFDEGESDGWFDEPSDISDPWMDDGESDLAMDDGESDPWYNALESDPSMDMGETDPWFGIDEESDPYGVAAESDPYGLAAVDDESDPYGVAAESDPYGVAADGTLYGFAENDGYYGYGSSGYGSAGYGSIGSGSMGGSARGMSYGSSGSAGSARAITTVTPVTRYTQVAQVARVTPQPIVQAQFYPVPSCQLHVTSTTYGGSVSIGYTTTNATQATLSGFGQVSIGSGTRTDANVTANRTYTMQVNGPGGSSSCAATVTVGTPVQNVVPTCTISANPTNVVNNGYSVVTWTSYNATTANLSGVGTVSTSGTTTVYPNVNAGPRTYTLTVYNNNRSNTCSTTVGSNYVPTPIPTPYPVPTPGNLACSLNATPNTIPNGAAANLTWNSTGAVRAFLSDGLGAVAPSGVLAVRPEASRNYVLTVIDPSGRQTTCATNVNVAGTPYVSLSQIPYTGVDFGPFGNAMYWFTLVSLSLVAGYLVVTKRGVFAGSVLGLVGASAHSSDPESMILDETIIDEPVQVETAPVPASVVTSVAPVAPEKVAVTSDTPTNDTMQFSTGNDGMPRLIINRS